ncbi:MAG: hypothetical protein AB1758_02555 [Candidatus Eremiobacterota bacterium]
MPILALLLLLTLPIRGQTLVECSVSVDGGPAFRLHSIYPNRKVYLEAAPLARHMGWSLVDRPDAEGILLAGKSVGDVVRLKGTTYVSAEAVAAAFGYRVTQRNEGLVVDFVTGTATTTPSQIQMRAGKVEKLTSPNAEYYQVRVAAYVKNPGREVVVLNARQFYVVDHNKSKVYCNGSFDVTLKPGEEARVEGLYFDVPKRSTLRTLGLEGKDGKSLATVGL